MLLLLVVVSAALVFAPLVLAYYLKARRVGSIVATLLSLAILAVASYPFYFLYLLADDAEARLSVGLVAALLALLCCLGGVVLYLTADKNN